MIDVFQNFDFPARNRSAAVARNGHKLEFNGELELPYEIGKENRRAAQNADQRDLLTRIVYRNALAKVFDSLFQIFFLNQRFRDPFHKAPPAITLFIIVHAREFCQINKRLRRPLSKTRDGGDPKMTTSEENPFEKVIQAPLNPSFALYNILKNNRLLLIFSHFS